jgi:hypothetical protein
MFPVAQQLPLLTGTGYACASLQELLLGFLSDLQLRPLLVALHCCKHELLVKVQLQLMAPKHKHMRCPAVQLLLTPRSHDSI